MSIKELTKRIDPKREYNLSHIRDEGLFPGAKDIRTVRKIVKKDFLGENILVALISGLGRASEYKVKGKNIIKFLNKYGEGMRLREKTRHIPSRKINL